MKLARVASIAQLRALAARRLPRAVFDFFDGGAEDEHTLDANRLAFERPRLLPRVLTDVSTVDMHADLLGRPAALPLAIAPMGAIGLGWHRADILLARAAAAAGVPYTLSSAAHASIEDVAREAPGRLWFQCYMLRNRDFVDGLIQRARAAGYEALMVTIDLPVGGKRERDTRNHFSLPFRYTARNVLDFASRPRWALQMLRHGEPVMANMAGLDERATTMAAMASTVGRHMDTAFDWSRLRQIRERWHGKLIVKGVLRADDARRLAELGCDALVVSNHGGRQLDGALATLDALPAVVAAVAGRVPVWLDGGVRRGRHVLQALALGASAVLVGRAALYGVAGAGHAGAEHALALLRDEFERSMRLCGVRSVGEIGPDLVAG